MHEEIEKKYLLRERANTFFSNKAIQIFSDTDNLADRVLKEGRKIRQGYLPVQIGKEIAQIIGLQIPFDPIEARLRHEGQNYYITFKGEGTLIREETPGGDINKTTFDLYWPYAQRRIEKVRKTFPVQYHNIEVDVFTDRDLILAEIEVQSKEEVNNIPILGEDVTENIYYKNKSLASTDFLRKFILTGGPCSGKSTAIDYLAKLQYPIVGESARQVIDDQLAYGGDVVPWKKLLEFQLEVLKTSLKEEERLSNWGTIFLDRGIPDGIAYCVLSGVEPPTPLSDAIKKQNYKGIFLLDPLPYRKDDARKEDENEAIKIHQGLFTLYRDLGFNPIKVPVNTNLEIEESIKERAHFIINQSHMIR